MPPVDRKNEQIVGYVFLGLMVVFLLLAITTFEGTPTVLLIVAAVLFLGVGLFMLGGGRGDGDDGQGQQQSVVLGDGRVVSQSSSGAPGGVLVVCPGCSRRVPERFAHCPDCGARLG